jgi:hypothetical protein
MTTIRKSIGSRRIPLHDHSDLNSGGKLRISSAISGGIETIQSVVPPSTSSGVSVSEEGADQGVASSLNFVGANVTAAVTAGAATITVAGSGGSVTFQDEGVAVGTGTILNFVGSGVVATESGGTITATVAGTAVTTTVIVQDEGSTIGTASVLNFTGSGGTASFSNGTATINITAGGSDLSSVIGTGSGATAVGTAFDTGASPLSLTAPAGIAEGDLVVLAGQFVNSIPNAAGPSGGAAFTEALRYDTSSNEYQVVYWKVAGTAETTWGLTHSAGTDCAVAAAVYRGSTAVAALWSKAFAEDSLTAPWVIGHPYGLRVFVWFTLTAGEPVLAVDGDSLTSDIRVEAVSANEPQVLIAHRDTVASFDAGPVRCIGNEIVTYPGAFTAVFSPEE